MANSRISSDIELGRKYDINFINWDGEEGVQGEALFVFGNKASKTTGIIKSVNKFIKILLTEKGSDSFNVSLGTNLSSIQYMGGLDEGEIGDFISEQVSSTLQQIQDIQAEESFLPDENIVSAVLSDIVKETEDSMRVKIRIITEAGEEVSVFVPITGGS